MRISDWSSDVCSSDLWSGSGGNADLQPFSAWQYDLGVEWYFDRGSVLGLGLFRKDVSDFVVPLVLDVTRAVNGEQVLIQPYSTVPNAIGRASCRDRVFQYV